MSARILLTLVPSVLLAAACGAPQARKVLGLEPPRPDRAVPPDRWREPIAPRPAPRVEPEEAPEAAREPVRARPRIAGDELHTLDLRGAPLSEALHLITSSAGINVYLDAGLDAQVDASFPAVRLDDALGVLLARNGLALVEDPPGIYWVEAHDGSEVVTRRFQLASALAGEVVESLKALVPGTTLVVDPDANFVVARGPERELSEIEAYLAAADRVKRQVLIEVEVLEIALEDEFELGIEAAFSDPNFLGEAGLDAVEDLATAGDAFTATLDLNDYNLAATINALEHYGTVEVLSSPRVLAITNTEAKIDVVREIPYIETTTEISSGSGSGTVGTTSQASVAFKEAGIKLKVRPVIQEGGLVQLAVSQEFSEVSSFFQGIPVLDTRRLDNHFVVRGDQAVLLGGLLQDSSRESEDGVPLLMHIPLLGRLFRNDVDSAARRELLVLITSRVLDPEEAAELSRIYEHNFQERVRASGGGE